MTTKGNVKCQGCSAFHFSKILYSKAHLFTSIMQILSQVKGFAWFQYSGCLGII